MRVRHMPRTGEDRVARLFGLLLPISQPRWQLSPDLQRWKRSGSRLSNRQEQGRKSWPKENVRAHNWDRVVLQAQVPKSLPGHGARDTMRGREGIARRNR